MKFLIRLLLVLSFCFAQNAFAAFPTIAGTQTSVTTPNNTSHTITYPSYSAGHLMIVQATCDGNPNFTWDAGFTSIIADTLSGTATKTGVRYKVMAGSEGASMSFTTSNTQECAFIAIAVAGYDTSTPLVASSVSADTGSAPDPANINPGSAADYKFMAGFGADDDDDSATYWSSSWSGVAQVESSSSATDSCLAAMQQRDLNAASTNPGAMNMDNEEEYVVWAFAIKPGSGGPSENTPTPTPTPTPTHTPTHTPTPTPTPTPTATPVPGADTYNQLPMIGVS